MSESNVNNSSQTRSIAWTKRLAYGFLSILLLCIITVLLAISPLGISLLMSQVNKLEGITLSGVSGSLYSALTADQLVFENEQITVKVQQANLELKMSCLLYGEVCLPSIFTNNIDILLKHQETTPAPSEPSNTYITLPLPVSVTKLDINSFQLSQQNENGANQALLDIENLQASLAAEQTFKVNQLSLASLTLHQQSKSNNDVPAPEASAFSLQDIANWQYQAIDIPQVFIPVNANLKAGSIKRLCVKGEQTQCIKNTLIKTKINEQTLDANISLEPEDMPLAKLALTAKIDLAKQFTHSISAEFTPNAAKTSKEAKPLQMNVDGNVYDTLFKLQNNNTEIVSLAISADITNEALPLSLNVSAYKLKRLVAQWLPNMPMPLSSIEAKLDGDTRLYTLEMKAVTLQKDASSIEANASLSLLDKTLALKELNTSGELGVFKAASSHTLTRGADQLELLNQVDVDFDEFKPMLLLATQEENANSTILKSESDVAASLNGQIALNLTYTDDYISGSLLCDDIQGRVSTLVDSSQAYDLRFLCDLTLAKDGMLDVNSFSLTQANNSIVGKGKLKLPTSLSASNLAAGVTNITETESDFSLSINMPNAASLYAALKGSIEGTASVKGPVLQPRINASVDASLLQYDNFKLDSLALDINTNIAENWQGALSLQANGLYQSNLLADSILVNAKGDMASHNMSIALEHSDYGLTHAFSGAVKTSASGATQWKGEWETGTWRLPFDQFVLSEATPLQVSASNSYIGAHCWLANEAAISSAKNELCFNKVQYEDAEASLIADLDYDLAKALEFYLPSMIQAGTKVPLRSDISVSTDANKVVTADIFNVITQANLKTTRHNIALSAIVANIRLDQQVLASHVFAGTLESGAIGLSSSLQLAPENRVHSGELRIESFDVSPLLRFVPGAQKLAGVINGKLDFDGSLDAPKLNGNLEISEGELIVDNYPYPFSNFNQTIDVVDNVANIEGEFELGSGDAEYNAKASFADGLSLSGNVRGAGMQIAYQNSELLASPDISFDVTPDNIKLNGSITIPNADIVIKELPKSAKAPTTDTIIIGKPAEPPIIPIGLDIDLNILLDVPKLKRVNIKALDLQASLAGDLQLRVRQEVNKTSQQYSPMQTYLNGSINILSGKYEAYGQMLQVRSGDIYFNGPPSLPQFDISAIRNPLNTEDNVIAGVQISGNPIMPKVELFSEPEMIQARQVSYLLQGTDIDGGEGTSTNVQLVNALVNYGISNGGNQVNKLGKSIGFDSLNIQTAGQGDNTQVQVTGRISDNIQVTYGVGLFESVSEVILKYQLLPKLYIEAKNGTDSTVDLFYELTRGDSM